MNLCFQLWNSSSRVYFHFRFLHAQIFFSTHQAFFPPTINPEMRLLQVSLRNAASERIQQILSGEQNQKRHCHCDKEIKHNIKIFPRYPLEINVH